MRLWIIEAISRPSGDYPVFTSEEGAAEFLERRLGGAFHIISLAESAYPNLIRHQGIKAQDLGEGRALIAGGPSGAYLLALPIPTCLSARCSWQNRA